MITRHKKIVYGVVLAGSIVMLVTQLVARGKSSSTPPPAEVPADGGGSIGAPRAGDAGSGSVAIAGDGSNVAAPRPTASESESAADDPAGQSAVGDTLAKLERALGSLRNFQSEATRPEFDPTAAPDDEADRPKDGQASRKVALSELVPPPPLVELRALLDAQPLCGIIHGKRDSAAMFGGRIVRVGDQLVPGDAVVSAIEPGAVRVSFQGNDLRIEMPPLRPRPKSSSSDGSQSSETPDEPESSAGAGTSPANTGSEAPNAATQTPPAQ